jgi:hypothetical protein
MGMMPQSSPSPLWGGIKGGGESHALSLRNHTPTLLDSTGLAHAKSYLASLPTRGRVDPVGVTTKKGPKMGALQNHSMIEP